MDVLVISGSSSRQRFDDRPVTCRDIDQTDRESLVDAHPEQAAPAADLYTGREHETVATAVESLESVAAVDWQIFSAGYGLVPADTEIVAYDCSFTDVDVLRARAESLGLGPGSLTNVETRRAVSRENGAIDTLESALADGYDLVVLALSSTYVEALGPALEEMPAATTVIAIAADSAASSLGAAHWLPATDRERMLLESNWVDLRGDLLERLAAAIDDEDDLAAICTQPSLAYLRSLGIACDQSSLSR